MNEAEQILTGITESHSTAGTGFIIGSGTRHIKGAHTLVLIPDICHTIYMLIVTLYMITGEKLVPVSIQFCECRINLFGCLELFEDFMCAVFANYVRSNKLLILWVLTVAKNEN